jgi:hypothetical protein
MSKKPGTDENQPEAGARPSDPHSRVWHHLRKLLSTGAVAGTALQYACCIGCSDPLSPPVECSRADSAGYLEDWLGWQGLWVATDAGGLVARVTLLVYSYGSASERLGFAADPVLTNAVLVDSSPSETGLTFTCLPDAGATEVVVSVPVSCDGAEHAFRLRLDLSGSRNPGDAIPIGAMD